MRLYRIVVETFEPSGPTPEIPIVVHFFQGATRAQAEGYYKAHLGTDRFMSACVKRGRFGTGSNAFACPSRITAGWVIIDDG